ncbi:Serine/threonine-protein phosphatase PP2A catalytic subunit 3 [Dictyocoela muelleri]|nr:Serine/threonine-protein phosphatase PP2A catalytic subunit 3 [Dictyocoela muelleri]
MDFFKNCLIKLINTKRLDVIEVEKIIEEIKIIFLNESEIILENSPCYVIGDIHGQYYDLLNIFSHIKARETEKLKNKESKIPNIEQNKTRKYENIVTKNNIIENNLIENNLTKNNLAENILTDNISIVNNFSDENNHNENIFNVNNFPDENEKIVNDDTKIKADISFNHINTNQISNKINYDTNEFDKILTKYISLNTKIICLGDYVDRGYNSIECILFLFLYKIIFKNIYLLKGNHESKLVNGVYGFKNECLEKYNEFIFIKFMDVFELMSICCVVDEKYFLVHGGIGKIDYKNFYLKFLNCKKRNIKDIERGIMAPDSIFYSKNEKLLALVYLFTTDVPENYSDYLWSDPGTDGLIKNSRGLGYLFGRDIVDDFLDFFSLECIIRSHQLVFEGYKKDFDGKVITIWSAPNYCYRMGNMGCILLIDNGLEFILIDKVDEQY